MRAGIRHCSSGCSSDARTSSPRSTSVSATPTCVSRAPSHACHAAPAPTALRHSSRAARVVCAASSSGGSGSSGGGRSGGDSRGGSSGDPGGAGQGDGPLARLLRILFPDGTIDLTTPAFLGIGAFICVSVVKWAAGSPMATDRPYRFHTLLPGAPNVYEGTDVRLNGAVVGAVQSMVLRMEGVDAEIMICNDGVLVPRGSIVEVNLQGLAGSAGLDIKPAPVPKAPLPAAGAAASAAAAAAGGGAGAAAPTAAERRALRKVAGAGRRPAATPDGFVALPAGLASPRDVEACTRQGLLVCSGGRLEGRLGGGMDELLRLSIKMSGDATRRP